MHISKTIARNPGEMVRGLNGIKRLYPNLPEQPYLLVEFENAERGVFRVEFRRDEARAFAMELLKNCDILQSVVDRKVP